MLQVHPRPALKDITNRSCVPIYRYPFTPSFTALCSASTSVSFVPSECTCVLCSKRNCKTRKIDCGCRKFNECLFDNYFVKQYQNKVLCMICNHVIAVMKKYNIVITRLNILPILINLMSMSVL